MRLIFTVFFVTQLTLGCSEPEQAFKEAVRPIAWKQVQPEAFEQIRRLSGTVYPVEATNLSFEVGGKVASVKVKLGDVVKRGQELAQLDRRNFDLSLQSSQANLQQANALLSESENEFNRYAELATKGLVSKSGYDSAKAGFESAASAVSLAKTQLDISAKDLRDTLLSAPYDGQITKRLVEPSMQVSPGQAVFEIEGADGLEIQLMVPETLIKEVAKGDDINIEFPAFPDTSSNGSITEIGSRAETANAFPVTILIQFPPDGLRAGMTAEANFTFEGIGRSGYQGEAFRLPVAAVGAGEGQTFFVFVYDDETEKLQKRIVETEGIINNKVLVSSGLAAGDIVAIAGISFLRDGQTVRLLDKHVQQFN